MRKHLTRRRVVALAMGVLAMIIMATVLTPAVSSAPQAAATATSTTEAASGGVSFSSGALKVDPLTCANGKAHATGTMNFNIQDAEPTDVYLSLLGTTSRETIGKTDIAGAFMAVDLAIAPGNPQTLTLGWDWGYEPGVKESKAVPNPCYVAPTTTSTTTSSTTPPTTAPTTVPTTEGSTTTTEAPTTTTTKPDTTFECNSDTVKGSVIKGSETTTDGETYPTFTGKATATANAKDVCPLTVVVYDKTNPDNQIVIAGPQHEVNGQILRGKSAEGTVKAPCGTPIQVDLIVRENAVNPLLSHTYYHDHNVFVASFEGTIAKSEFTSAPTTTTTAKPDECKPKNDGHHEGAAELVSEHKPECPPPSTTTTTKPTTTVPPTTKPSTTTTKVPECKSPSGVTVQPGYTVWEGNTITFLSAYDFETKGAVFQLASAKAPNSKDELKVFIKDIIFALIPHQHKVGSDFMIAAKGCVNVPAPPCLGVQFDQTFKDTKIPDEAYLTIDPKILTILGLDPAKFLSGDLDIFAVLGQVDWANVKWDDLINVLMQPQPGLFWVLSVNFMSGPECPVVLPPTTDLPPTNPPVEGPPVEAPPVVLVNQPPAGVLPTTGTPVWVWVLRGLNPLIIGIGLLYLADEDRRRMFWCRLTVVFTGVMGQRRR